MSVITLTLDNYIMVAELLGLWVMLESNVHLKRRTIRVTKGGDHPDLYGGGILGDRAMDQGDRISDLYQDLPQLHHLSASSRDHAGNHGHGGIC